MRAVGYFRETPQGESLAQQNRAFLDFCEREGYEVAGTFADGASSNGHAPGFRQLVSFLRERGTGFVIVVVPTVRALGFGVEDAALRYFQLAGLGAQVTMLSGTGDPAAELISAWTQDGDRPPRPGDRVRAAMRRKAVRGEVLGRPPYGYKVGNRRRLELVPEEAVVVRYMFRLYLHEQMGIRLIARRLNEEGIRTRRGGNWSMVSIRDLLRNRAYLGTYSRFGVRVPGSHPPLVSAADFREVHDRLNARRTSFAPRHTSQFLLSGMVVCGYCGNKLIGVSRRQAWKRRSGEQVSNSYRYYQCESRTNQSVCGYHTRRADALEQEVRSALSRIMAADDAFPESGEEGAVEHQRREIDRLRVRVRTIDRRFAGYVNSAARGRLTREKMASLSMTAASDRLATEDALEAAEHRLDEHVSVAERRKERQRALIQLLYDWDASTFAEQQAGLREAIDRIVVRDDDVSVSLRP